MLNNYTPPCPEASTPEDFEFLPEEYWKAKREYEEHQAQLRADEADLMWGWE